MADLPHVTRHCAAHGALLIVLGLVAGLTIGATANPRSVLAAHVIGITAGLAAIAFSFLLPHAVLPQRLKTISAVLLIVALYIGFLTQWIGGLLGLLRMFIVTAAGQPEGAPWLELSIEILVKGISPITILPFLLVAYGLFRRAEV
jgi:hypothetical protein